MIATATHRQCFPPVPKSRANVIAAALILLALTAADSTAQDTSLRNGRWEAIRNQQHQIEQVASGLGVAISDPLSSAWNDVSATEESLASEGGQLADEEGRLLAQEGPMREEDRGLIAEYYKIMDNRTALEAERARVGPAN